MYGKRHSIIQQPPNPTLFSGPIECRIREVSLYTERLKLHALRRSLQGSLTTTKFYSIQLLDCHMPTSTRAKLPYVRHKTAHQKCTYTLMIQSCIAILHINTCMHSHTAQYHILYIVYCYTCMHVCTVCLHACRVWTVYFVPFVHLQ